MKCKGCNCDLKEGVKFCEYCGTPVDNSINDNVNTNVNNNNVVNNLNSKKNNKTMIFVIVLIVIGVLCIFYLANNQGSEIQGKWKCTSNYTDLDNPTMEVNITKDTITFTSIYDGRNELSSTKYTSKKLDKSFEGAKYYSIESTINDTDLYYEMAVKSNQAVLINSKNYAMLYCTK